MGEQVIGMLPGRERRESKVGMCQRRSGRTIAEDRSGNEATLHSGSPFLLESKVDRPLQRLVPPTDVSSRQPRTDENW